MEIKTKINKWDLINLKTFIHQRKQTRCKDNPKSTKITARCWTAIHRRTLEPTENGTLCPKAKKKPQQDGRRGANMIKPNPMLSECADHKLENNNTKEVLPLLWRFWAPCQVSQPRDPTKGLGSPREADLEGQKELITALPQDWGKQRPHSWRAQTKYCVYQDPGERSRKLN